MAKKIQIRTRQDYNPTKLTSITKHIDKWSFIEFIYEYYY